MQCILIQFIASPPLMPPWSTFTSRPPPQLQVCFIKFSGPSAPICVVQLVWGHPLNDGRPTRSQAIKEN